MTSRTLLSLTLVTAVAAAGSDLPFPASTVHASDFAACDTLASLQAPQMTVSVARVVDAGAFSAPGAASQAAAFRSLPAFCRVAATLTPSSDSDITIEVWLPIAGWNGNLQAVGNGAFSGAVPYSAMATALTRGYAVTGTDTGHAGGSAIFGLGHPERVIDFGWRAVHEMTVTAKTIVAGYYERAASRTYWNGCSAGGRQGLKAAQRFPADFDGIVAGAPGLDWTGRAGQALRVAKPLESNEGARLLQPHRQLLHRGVVESCDGRDGVTDGVIENPAACAFDPAALLCNGTGSAGCLSAAQVQTARMIYAAEPNPRTGRPIMGLSPGSELGWTDLGWTASARATGLDQFRYLVFADPAWEIRRFDFAADIVRAEERDRDTINALDPNLKPFIDRGGKLIQYHGWGDPQISPGTSVQYYQRVVDALGDASRVHASYRLFMAPGMGHCGGGEGPNTFDALAALEQWVEHGNAPDRLVASRVANGAVSRTRPLCPYPQVAIHDGKGSIDEAASFSCRVRR